MTDVATKQPEAARTGPLMTIEPCTGRVQASLDGEVVADSNRALVLQEGSYKPRTYFPPEDVRSDLLKKTDHRTHCPHKGDASYWSLTVGARSLENAVWGYEDPMAAVITIKGYLSFVDDVEVTS